MGPRFYFSSSSGKQACDVKDLLLLTGETGETGYVGNRAFDIIRLEMYRNIDISNVVNLA